MKLSKEDEINFLLNGSILDLSKWNNYPTQIGEETFSFDNFEKIVLDNIKSSNPGSQDLLLMSGGWDSGLLLELMCRINNSFSAVSWGWGNEISEGSDADIARKRCERKGIPHYYINLEKGWTSDRIKEFYLDTDGVRTDHFNSYVASAERKRFWEMGFRRVWRADEAFGWLYNLTSKDTRVSLALGLPKDFNFVKAGPVNWSEHHRIDVTLRGRDEFYFRYRLPIVIGTLSLPWKKTGFNVITPFIDNNVVEYCSRMSWADRTEKKNIKINIQKKYPEIATDVVSTASIPEPLTIWSNKNNIAGLTFETRKAPKMPKLFFLKKLIRNLRGYDLGWELLEMRKEILKNYNF